MNNKDFEKSLSEVWEVLENSEQSIIDKISKKFLYFVKENKDDNFKPNIDFSDESWKTNLSEDAKAVIALIYRDYIASEEERKEILEKEKNELATLEEEKRKKYNPDNIFKKNTTTDTDVLSSNDTGKTENIENNLDEFFENGTNNIDSKNNTSNTNSNENTELLSIAKVPWYKSILNKILTFFGKKNK